MSLQQYLLADLQMVRYNGISVGILVELYLLASFFTDAPALFYEPHCYRLILLMRLNLNQMLTRPASSLMSREVSFSVKKQL